MSDRMNIYHSKSRPACQQLQKTMVAPGLIGLLLFGLQFAAAVPAGAVTDAAALPVPISGWPLPGSSPESLWGNLGDDPVVGRLACPPVTRLNLSTRSSDLLLVRAIKIDKLGAGQRWTYTLRTGLSWWSGEAVTGRDLASFLQAGLQRVVKARGHGLWTLPAFTINVPDAVTVEVLWQQAPAFGPHVMDGVALHRPLTDRGSAKELAFECIGLHRWRPGADGTIALEPRDPSSASVAWRLLPNGEGRLSKTVGPGLEFVSASQAAAIPAVRAGDQAMPCAVPIEMPYFSLIAWSATSPTMHKADMRRLMTQLVPRGALVMAGAASMGELLTAPIPRNHPGYLASLPLRPSDIEGVAHALERLGYTRRGSDEVRTNKQREPLSLSLGVSGNRSDLLEKVMLDAFRAAGVGLRFVGSSEPEIAQVDGHLGVYRVDWPAADLLAAFHSKAQDPGAGASFVRIPDPGFDRLLEKYSSSLTWGKPDFQALRTIHAKLYEFEPVTMIMQHKACLVSRGLSIKPDGLNTLDPDWFRQFASRIKQEQ